MTQGSVTPEQIVGGDFVLKRRIKSGGFGTVYEAEQRSTKYPRAIKILHAEFSHTPSSVMRFHVEATAGARVRSDYVVKVIAAGVDTAFGAWIAMEYLEGNDLADHVRARGPMPWTDARRVLQHVCHALGAAHRVGIVHRDLKPENIFLAQLTSLEGGFVTKVLDFGIAKVVEGTSTLTAGIGSWAWLAPEQASMHSTVTPATDVWALGLVAFFLLTGKSYWLCFQDGAEGNILYELGQPVFEPASLRALRLGCENRMPNDFDAWFARCVAQRERFRNAEEAYAALPAALGRTDATTEPRADNLAPRHSAIQQRRGVNSPFKASASVGTGRWRLRVFLTLASALLLFGLYSVNRASPSAPVSPATTEPIVTTAPVPVLAATRSTTSGASYTPPTPDAPGCSADCGGGCKHVLVSAGPAYDFFERLARRQREDMGLCSEITRLPRRANVPADQFSYSLWLPATWMPPANWPRSESGTPPIPDTSIPWRDDLIRVSNLRGDPLYPPPCQRSTLSYTSEGKALVGNDAFQRCEMRPPSESIEKDGTWSWKEARGGWCSCAADESMAGRLRDLGACLMNCRTDAACVDACEMNTRTSP